METYNVSRMWKGMLGNASATGNNWERGNSTLHSMCIKEGEGTWKEDRGKNALPAG